MNSTGKYDVCFVCFADPALDGRTINIIREASRLGLDCLLIAFESDSEIVGLENVKQISFPCVEGERILKRLIRFNRFCKSIILNAGAKKYWSSDFFALSASKQLANYYKAKLIYDSREIYSALGPLSGKKIKQAVITYMEKRLVSSVDEFVVSGELDGQYLASHFRTQKTFHLIMNLPPYKQPVTNNELKQNLGMSENETLLIYQGAVLKGRGIESAAKAVSQMPNTRLIVIGEGPSLKEFKEKYKLLIESRKVFFWGSVPYSELHYYTCGADIGICFIEPVSFSYELALPNKLFEYTMAGKPSLISDLPAMRLTAEKYDIGKLIHTGANNEELIEAIENIKTDYEYYSENCLNAAHELAYESMIPKIKTLLL